MGDLSLLHFFVYSFIHLYQYGLMGIYFILWIIIQCYVNYFFSQIVPALGIGSSFRLVLCPFDIPPSFCFWSTSLLSGSTRCYRLILYIPCPSPTISHFSKELCFILSEMMLKNMDLGIPCACCYWSVTDCMPSQQKTRKYDLND